MRYKNVDLRLPELDELAQLAGTGQDFYRAGELCLRWERLAVDLGEDPKDELRNREILDAVAQSAVVRYARPWAGGKRSCPAVKQALQEGLEALSQRERDQHRFFKDLRDLYYAHSINTFEEDVPVASISEEGILQGVATRHQDVYGIVAEERIGQLKGLSEKMSKAIARASHAEKLKAEAFVREAFSPAELQAMGVSSSPPTNFDDPSTERKRVKKRQ